MTTNYYQNRKEKLCKEACERYQNLSEEEKMKKQKKVCERYQNLTGKNPSVCNKDIS